MKLVGPDWTLTSACSRLPFSKRRAGYSLLEIVVVVAILATVVGLATPSFIRMIEQQRVQAVLRRVDLGLLDLRMTSQSEARVINATEAEQYLAEDLPLGWYIAVSEQVVFSSTGTCDGGSVRITTADERVYAFDLAPRSCSLQQRVM